MDWIRLGWCSLLSIIYLCFLIWYCNLSFFCRSASWSADKRSRWYLGWAPGAKSRAGWAANSDEQGRQRIYRVEVGADLMCSCCSGAFGWRGWPLGYCWVDWATAGRTIQVAESMLLHHCRISWTLWHCVEAVPYSSSGVWSLLCCVGLRWQARFFSGQDVFFFIWGACWCSHSGSREICSSTNSGLASWHCQKSLYTLQSWKSKATSCSSALAAALADCQRSPCRSTAAIPFQYVWFFPTSCLLST